MRHRKCLYFVFLYLELPTKEISPGQGTAKQFRVQLISRIDNDTYSHAQVNKVCKLIILSLFVKSKNCSSIYSSEKVLAWQHKRNRFVLVIFHKSCLEMPHQNIHKCRQPEMKQPCFSLGIGCSNFQMKYLVRSIYERTKIMSNDRR